MKKILKKISIFAFVFGLGAGSLVSQTESPAGTPSNSETQIDVTRRPEPLAKREFAFPAYTTNVLPNGLKLFFIPDNEQPTATLRLLIKGGSSQDGSKAGIAEIAADMVFKGTKTRSADSIARLLDGLGVSFSTSATPDYTIISLSGLKKHYKVMFNVLLDVLTAPTFPEEELDKLKQLYISSVRESMARGPRLAQMLAAKAVYGEGHPYAQSKTVDGIASITKDDILNYFKKFYLPNNSTLTIVGGFHNENTTLDLQASWMVWQRGIAPTINLPKADPMPYGVYFVPRPSSVQSSIAVCSRTVPYGATNYNELNLDANVIGGGFSGRLFRTLREKHSYTYSPFGNHSQNKYANMFICGAEVRNSVTDSAIDVTLEQLRDLATKPADTVELAKVKSYYTGKYLMSFEDTEFIANLVQNANFLDRNMDEVRNYATIINEMTPLQLKIAAEEFMNPKKSYIVVVGSPEVLPKLQKYGKVFEFTEELSPTFGENAKMDQVKYDAEELIDKYGSACGSLKKMKRTESMIAKATFQITMRGKTFDGTMTKEFSGTKFHQETKSAQINQSIWRDGNTVRYRVVGPMEQPDSIETEKQIFNGTIFPVAKLIDMGYKCKVLGKLKDRIVMKAVSPKGIEYLFYFNAETFLLEKSEQYDKAQGAKAMLEETYSNYKEFDGIMLPTRVSLANPFFAQTIDYTYQINPTIDPATFVIPKE